ncbi:hypothetical protein ACFWIB_17050 [Streptomyces sp. NPDC127051]|uniref:hypothetical protein n=1 Tax=Streptomyces sp. NPDC127051 TaxID=3347119 RepID=UPI003665CA0E
MPRGSHRELLTELHTLYRLAGHPGLRKISDEITDSDNFDATVNRNLISKILSGKTIPTPLQLDTLVRYFISLGLDDANPTKESARLRILLSQVQESASPTPSPTKAPTSLNEALQWAGSTGSPESLIRICINAKPEFVLSVLDELSRRHWVAFRKAVRESLGETFSPNNIPSLIAEMRLAGSHRWGVDDILTTFARVRSVTETVELIRLMDATGQTGDVVSILRAFMDRPDAAEISSLYVSIFELGISPWTLEDNRVRREIETQKLAAVAMALAEVGRSDIATPAVHHWIHPHISFQGVDLALEIERAGREDQAEDLLKEALRRGRMTYAYNYLGSDSIPTEEKDGFTLLMRRIGEPIEGPRPFDSQ